MYQNRSDSDRHSSYMDGIPVKISELYKPPKRISLPLGIANRQPIENFEKYDFRLERSTAEKMARLRELKKANMEKRRQRIAEEDRKIEDLKKAAELKQKACETATAQKQDSTPTQETDIPPERKPIIVENDNPVEKRSEVASYMLTPVPVNQTHNQQLINSFDPINISDFESDSSPFDNMELKTLNDIAELASVLQPNNGSQYSAYNHRISNQTFNQRLSNQSIHDQTYNQDSQRLGNQPIHDQTYNQDSHRLSNQAIHDQTYNQDSHQPMLDQQGYQIKPSRPFIQQSTPNIPPSNGYRINGLYGGSNVFSTSSVSDSFWNNQQTVSYSSTRTTPSAYGGAVSATYRPEFSGYFQNNDYRPENSDYSSNVCMPRTGLFGSAVSQQTTSTASDIGTSKYMLPTSNDTRLVGITPATRISSNNSEYLAGAREYAPNYSWTNYNYQPQNVSYDVSRAQTSDQLVPSRPQTSDNLVESRVRPSDNRVQPSDNLAQSRVRPSDTLVENRLQPSDNQAENRHQTSDNLVESCLKPSDTLVESRQSTDSGVTDLIRQLKLDLDDRRESDCRKLIENETKNSSDKLKQKISSAVVAPQLPNPIEQLTPSCRQLVHRIAEMGFAEERVARAVQRLGNNETKVLEFLLQVQRLEEESGCPGERVEQALIANRFDTVESARYLEILQQLLDLGFVETKVAEALAQHANDRDKAIESLIS